MRLTRPDISLDPRLRLVTEDPLNAETSLSEHTGVVTPNPLFYLRNRFAIPQIDVGDWALVIDGEVERPLRMGYEELRSLPSRSLTVTLECAGNGRSGFQPRADGEPWEYGAVGTAEWQGVPLRTVLEAAGLTPEAREIVVEGSDGGLVPDREEAIPFARGLRLEKALDPDTLLAYTMNGEPLPVAHGFPVRLIVPGWYGMASVKWIRRIEAIAGRFDGYFQLDRYVLPPLHDGAEPRQLTDTRVRSLIVEPEDGAILPAGERLVRGLAWSGSPQVEQVEVSVDGGATWERAAWVTDPERYAWRGWEYLWNADIAGPAVLQSRAVDADGNAQPVEAEWNRLGYANNAIQTVQVRVEG